MTKLIFTQSKSALKQVVATCGRGGSWRWRRNRSHLRFSGLEGEILNWWPTKGTVQFQGRDADAFRMEFKAAVIAANTKGLGMKWGFQNLAEPDQQLVDRIARRLRR